MVDQYRACVKMFLKPDTCHISLYSFWFYCKMLATSIFGL